MASSSFDSSLQIPAGQGLQHGQSVGEVAIDGPDGGGAYFCNISGGQRLKTVFLNIFGGSVQNHRHPLGAAELNGTYSNRTVARNLIELVLASTHRR